MDKKLIKEISTVTLDIAAIEQEASKAVAHLKQRLDSLREAETDLKSKLLVAMEKSGTTKFENDVLKISYVASSTRNSIDVTRLKEEKPDVAAEYMKQSSVKPSVRIKIKETI